MTRQFQVAYAALLCAVAIVMLHLGYGLGRDPHPRLHRLTVLDSAATMQAHLNMGTDARGRPLYSSGVSLNGWTCYSYRPRNWRLQACYRDPYAHQIHQGAPEPA